MQNQSLIEKAKSTLEFGKNIIDHSDLFNASSNLSKNQYKAFVNQLQESIDNLTQVNDEELANLIEQVQNYSKTLDGQEKLEQAQAYLEKINLIPNLNDDQKKIFKKRLLQDSESYFQYNLEEAQLYSEALEKAQKKLQLAESAVKYRDMYIFASNRIKNAYDKVLANIDKAIKENKSLYASDLNDLIYQLESAQKKLDGEKYQPIYQKAFSSINKLENLNQIQKNQLLQKLNIVDSEEYESILSDSIKLNSLYSDIVKLFNKASALVNSNVFKNATNLHQNKLKNQTAKAESLIKNDRDKITIDIYEQTKNDLSRAIQYVDSPMNQFVSALKENDLNGLIKANKKLNDQNIRNNDELVEGLEDNHLINAFNKDPKDLSEETLNKLISLNSNQLSTKIQQAYQEKLNEIESQY